jgi:hypothetical protein
MKTLTQRLFDLRRRQRLAERFIRRFARLTARLLVVNVHDALGEACNNVGECECRAWNDRDRPCFDGSFSHEKAAGETAARKENEP